jgi:hypothetical protein
MFAVTARAMAGPSIMNVPTTKTLRPFSALALSALLVLLSGLQACRQNSQPSKSASASQPAPTSSPDNSLPPVEASRPSDNQGAVKADIHNVLFRLTGDASAYLENVSGELWPIGKYEVPVFDDKNSFELHVTNGTVSITPAALAAVMNRYSFARDDAPLKEISAEIQGDRLIIKGRLHSKKDLPFETAGELTVNSDGRLRLRTEQVKALHVPVKKAMALFGIELANVINTAKAPGMDTDQNDLIIDLGQLLPPPHIRGKIISARLTSNQITVIYGNGGNSLAAGPPEPGNYMLFRGNRVKFGRLVMENTELAILDLNPEDPLDWYQDRYKDQLVAGYSKITEHFGLRAYVRDFAKLPKRPAGKPSSDSPPNP